MTISDTLETKSFGALEIKNAAAGEVTAIIATLNQVDNDGDVIPDGAIPEGMKATISSYSHDTVMGTMLGTGVPDAPPVGKGAIHIERNKAVFRGQYFMETERGKQAFLTMKAMGADQPWSFAYFKTKVDKPTDEWAAKGARRILTKLGPLPGSGAMEVSPVKMPGGVGTGTVSLKTVATRDDSFEDLVSKGRQLVERIRRDWTIDPKPEWGTVELASRVLRVACKSHRLQEPWPRLRWFLPDGKKWGRYDLDHHEIWIDNSLKGDQLIETIGHEVGHALDPWAGEGSAQKLGEMFLEKWHDPRYASLIAAYSAPDPTLADMKEVLRRAKETLARTAHLVPNESR